MCPTAQRPRRAILHSTRPLEQVTADKQTNKPTNQLSTWTAQRSTRNNVQGSYWRIYGQAAIVVGSSATYRALDSKRVGAPRWCRRYTQGGIIFTKGGKKLLQGKACLKTIGGMTSTLSRVIYALSYPKANILDFARKLYSLDFDEVVFQFLLRPACVAKAP